MNADDDDTGPGFTRRQILAGGAASVLAAGCGDPIPDDGVADESDTGTGTGGDSGIVPIPDGMSAVAIVHREAASDAVRRAIDLAGGIDEIEPGQSVFIKVNAVHPFGKTTAIVTGRPVLRAVIELLRERDVGTITVGDRSSRGFVSEDVLRDTGLAAAALNAGADEIYGAPTPADDPDAWMLAQPPAWDEVWSSAGGIQVMRRLVEADHIINIPVCKNHRWAAFSLSLKNMIGGVGDDSRDLMHYEMSMPDDLSRAIAILSQAFTPTMNIIDAIGSLLNGGPEGVLPDSVHVETELVMASKDRVALDAAGAALLKLELSRNTVAEPDALHDFLRDTPIWEIPQIVHGAGLGLGRGSPDEVELRFDDVPDESALDALFRA
jgi:uncharacterized protein (DUF362 family)